MWEAIATELKGVINVAKVDASVEENKALTDRFNINSYPSIYLIEMGNFHMTKAMLPKAKLVEFALGGYKQNPQHQKSQVPPMTRCEILFDEEKIEHHSDVVELTDENFEHLVGQ